MRAGHTAAAPLHLCEQEDGAAQSPGLGPGQAQECEPSSCPPIQRSDQAVLRSGRAWSHAPSAGNENCASVLIRAVGLGQRYDLFPGEGPRSGSGIVSWTFCCPWFKGQGSAQCWPGACGGVGNVFISPCPLSLMGSANRVCLGAPQPRGFSSSSCVGHSLGCAVKKMPGGQSTLRSRGDCGQSLLSPPWVSLSCRAVVCKTGVFILTKVTESARD